MAVMAGRSHIGPAVRQAKILDLLVQRGAVKVGPLAAQFDTSAETIRRDLTVLADAGKIRKIHGGARVNPTLGEGEFDVRMRRNALAKQLIAEKLAVLVRPGQTIFMDTGSTSLIAAGVLAQVKKLTVITNSTRIAAAFTAGNGGADVYLLGGLYRGDNAQTVGAGTTSEIANYWADTAIITIGALDCHRVMDFSNQEAMVARAMTRSASELIVLADRTKFNQSAAFSVCGLDGVDKLVTDKSPNESLSMALEQAEVEVH